MKCYEDDDKTMIKTNVENCSLRNVTANKHDKAKPDGCPQAHTCECTSENYIQKVYIYRIPVTGVCWCLFTVRGHRLKETSSHYIFLCPSSVIDYDLLSFFLSFFPSMYLANRGGTLNRIRRQVKPCWPSKNSQGVKSTSPNHQPPRLHPRHQYHDPALPHHHLPFPPHHHQEVPLSNLIRGAPRGPLPLPLPDRARW